MQGQQSGGSSGGSSGSSPFLNAMAFDQRYANAPISGPVNNTNVTIPGGGEQGAEDKDYFDALMEDLYQRMSARNPEPPDSSAPDIGWARGQETEM